MGHGLLPLSVDGLSSGSTSR